ncbi:MAG: SprB repeat-containing protein, partial [Cyclobacteriaceae bacterium]|nr:SprB repeat-containing protein [Cyclobacteriaceae bacterium]
MANLYLRGCPRVSIILFFLTISLFSFSQTQPAADLDQARNGAADSPISPVNWVNGNAGEQNSHYIEGYSIPYRSVMTLLPLYTDITIEIEYDIKHSGHNAIDYLTTYPRLESHTQFGHPAEVVDPVSDYPEIFQFSTFPIPEPSSMYSPVPNQPTNSFNDLPASDRLMTIYNGTISNIQYNVEGNLNASQSSTSLLITFQANDPTVILTWGGHIASRLDWGMEAGEPRSAGGISGSPYHMRLINWTLNNLGNQDRSLSTAAVIVFPPCAISGPEEICVNGNTYEYFADVTTDYDNSAVYSFFWELVDNTSGATISDPTANPVQVVPGTGGSFKVMVTITNLNTNVSSICWFKCPDCIDGGVTVQEIAVVATKADEYICSNGSTQLNALVTGGTEPYTYLWMPASGLSDPNIANPVASPTETTTYTVYVSDNSILQDPGSACNAEASVTVEVGADLSLVLEATDVSCMGSSDGAIDLTVTGGVGPYSYL